MAAIVRRMDSRRPTPHHLGELFLDQGILTHDELEDALLEQQASGGRIGAILVRRGVLSSDELTEALTLQLGLVAHGSSAGDHEVPAPGRQGRGHRRRFRLRRAAEDGAALHEPDRGEGLAAVRGAATLEQAELDHARLEIVGKDRQIAALRARLELLDVERVELAAAMRHEILELQSELERGVSPEPGQAPVSSAWR